MNEQRRLELATRRGELSALIGVQRTLLAQQVWPVTSSLGGIDRVLAGIAWLKHNPPALVAGIVTLIIVRPRRAWCWSKRLFFVWRGWQGLRAKFLG